MEDVPYGRILREGWLIMVIAALLGGAVGYGLAKMLPETYTATSTLLLQVESKQASLFERNEFSLARIKTYPALVDSPDVVDGVRADLGLSEAEYSDRDIRRMLSADNAIDTVLLTVRADAPTAPMAADMANSAAQNLSALIEDTENSATDTRYDVSLDQMIPAVEPASPSAPQVLAIAGLGAIAGFAIGAIFCVFRTTTNRRISTISDVRRASGLPVVGRLPRRAHLDRVRARAAEEAAYEDAMNNLFALAGADVSRFLLVPVSNGSVDADTLHGLLGAYEVAGRRACVLDLRPDVMAEDADMRSLSELFDHVPSAMHAQASRRVPAVSTIYAMSTRIPTSTLESEISAVVTRLAPDFDVIVIVSQPTASKLIEATVGTGAGVVLCVRHNGTSATDLVSVATRLRVMGVHPVGVLMTHASAGGAEVAAESWRETDRNQIVSVDAQAADSTRDAAGLADASAVDHASEAPDAAGAPDMPADDGAAAHADAPVGDPADIDDPSLDAGPLAEPAAVGSDRDARADPPSRESGAGRGTD